MCGIAGVISSKTLGETEIRIVHEMIEHMVHRGPDSSGFFVDGHFAMGMRRLSIIDLKGGDQPIFNEDGDVAITCNGEIYNHRDLRRELRGSGHVFCSHSDVENIVHLYEEHGLKCAKFLRGMFAFALWDARQKKLILARDRIGEKPLYLYRDGSGRLWFASEIRSIISAMGESSISLDPGAINLFLTFQYVPEPDTFLEKVTLLPAGHLLCLTPDNIDNAPEPYWTFLNSFLCSDDPIEVVRETLDEACLLMGNADVPVGIALSGGIDSSLVAALTVRHYPGQVRAFSVGYPGRPTSDERSIAHNFAGMLGIPFTEVEVSTEEVVKELPELVFDMDTPVGDIAAYGYYAVSRAARSSGVPVLLSGIGGDEFFWGYEWVRKAVERNSSRSRTLMSLLKSAFGKEPLKRGSFFEVHEELRLGDQWSRAVFTRQALGRIPDQYWLNRGALDQHAPVDMAVSDLLIRTWLRSNCLTLLDRVSMANSVEMRLPLLDVKLIERLIELRNSGLQDWKKTNKWLLIRTFGKLLPPEILYRRKQGFTPPVHTWISAIADVYKPLLAEGALVRCNILDPFRLSSIQSRLGQTFLYKLILLEIWVRLILERASIFDIFEELSLTSHAISIESKNHIDAIS